jgi:hypothetical protein
MKQIKSILSVTLAATGLLVSTGCQTVSTSQIQYIGVPQYPPTDPAQVQILRTAPTRPHIRLGEVRAEPASESMDVTTIETAIKKAAAKLGADAAVIVSDKTQIVGAQAVGGYLDRSFETVQGRVVIAVAIKYQ